MRNKKIVAIVVAGCLALCVAGYFGLPLLIFHPVHLTDTNYLHERGMFRDVDIERCTYTQDLEPEMKCWVSILLPNELSYFGSAELSEENLVELLHEYTWEECTITEEQWENDDISVLSSAMPAFKKLKSQYVGKTFWICHDFDRERMCFGGDGRAYLLPNTHTMYFYYHRM